MYYPLAQVYYFLLFLTEKLFHILFLVMVPLTQLLPDSPFPTTSLHTLSSSLSL